MTTTNTHTYSHPTAKFGSPEWAAATNGMAVAGFVHALASWVLVLAVPLAVICWVLGVVFSGIGLHRVMNEGRGRRGLAIAGLVLSLGPVALGMTAIMLMMAAA